MSFQEAVDSSTPISEETSKPSSPRASEIPNGGTKAWLQVAGGFVLQFNTWGIINSFGVFQTYYQITRLPNETPDNISWIGSIQVFLLLLGGLLAGPVFDRGRLRPLLAIGIFCVCFGMFMTSMCSEYWQYFLAQGVLMGFGFGCLFLPTITIVAQYFTTKKSIAFGISTLGASIGGVVYPVIFRQLEPRVGFGWTIRIIAFIMLAGFVVPLEFMAQRVLTTKKKRFSVGLEAYRSKPLAVFAITNLFGFMGIFIPFYYTQLYAMAETTIDDKLAVYLLPMINASTLFGRLISNYFADKIGPLNMLLPNIICAAILSYCWVAIKSSSGIIVFAILYGIFAGPFNSLPGVTIISLSPDLSTIGVQIGVSLTIAGIGSLIGEPIAGALLRSQGGWTALQAWSGSLLVMCALFCISTRALKVGWRLNVKI